MAEQRDLDAVAGAGPALFRIVRFWSRRWIFGGAEEQGGDEQRVRDVLVLEAVDGVSKVASEVSVADVAHQLGIDRSGASRLISDAIGRGHLERANSPLDARRAVLAITTSGQQLLDDAHEWQQATFAKLTAKWDRADSEQLAVYLRRLAEEVPPSASPAR